MLVGRNLLREADTLRAERPVLGRSALLGDPAGTLRTFFSLPLRSFPVLAPFPVRTHGTRPSRCKRRFAGRQGRVFRRSPLRSNPARLFSARWPRRHILWPRDLEQRRSARGDPHMVGSRRPLFRAFCSRLSPSWGLSRSGRADPIPNVPVFHLKRVFSDSSSGPSGIPSAKDRGFAQSPSAPNTCFLLLVLITCWSRRKREDLAGQSRRKREDRAVSV